MSNQIIPIEDLKRYLAGVFDIEMDIYTMESTIDRMYQKYSSLGLPKKVRAPERRFSKVSIVDCMTITGFIIGVLSAIIGFIYELNVSQSGFFHFIGTIIAAAIYGVIGFIAGGLVIGGIIGIYKVGSDQNRLDALNDADWEKHNAFLKKDEKRMALERKQKNALGKEIQALESQLEKSVKNLKTAYSYNVIDPEYRNIYAISSFYGYIKKGRTNGLRFNEQTGDVGAYNIYENERRLDKIITNTDEILSRLDDVVNNQYVLAEGLRQATTKIDYLYSNVNNHLKRVSDTVDNIERCTVITAYNSQRTANELAFMNWVNCFR